MESGELQVSIAYQGGGAKLFDLLAAVEAARQLEKSNKEFRLLRVSGASAGAIAAVIHALDGDIGAVLAKAREFDNLLVKKFPKKRMKLLPALARLWAGYSIFDEDAVHTTLLRLLEEAKIDGSRTIGDLMSGRSVQLRIVSSDILGLQTPVHDQSSPMQLVEALTDSCAIPFAFRMPVQGSAKGNILDGGLFQNLPAKEALKDLPAGARALGVSFNAPKRKSVEGSNFIGYGAALIDSMISERVAEAANRLGPANVIQLTTDTGTFDFQTLFKGEVWANFQDKRAKAAGLLQEWFERSLRRSTPNWFSTESHDLLELEYLTSEKIAEFFEPLRQEGWHADEARHEVFAQSLLGEENPDVYTTTLKISGIRNPNLQFFRFRFYVPDGQQLLEPSVRVEDAAGKLVRTMMLPLRERGAGRVRSVLICLPKPLGGTESISIVKTEKAFGAMRGYLTEGWSEETLALGPGRKADILAITAHFPRAYEPKLSRDAVGDNDQEKAKLSKLEGIQVRSTLLRTEDIPRDFVTLTHTSSAVGPEVGTNRFLSVFYYRHL